MSYKNTYNDIENLINHGYNNIYSWENNTLW